MQNPLIIYMGVPGESSGNSFNTKNLSVICRCIGLLLLEVFAESRASITAHREEMLNKDQQLWLFGHEAQSYHRRLIMKPSTEAFE